MLAPPPSEVPLKAAPLIRVIAQVRFPLIMAVERRDFVAPFQEAIRDSYPVLRPEQTQAVAYGVGLPQTVQSSTVWRFQDIEARWRSSLAPDFIALETSAYTSRTEFFDRFGQLLSAVESHLQPRMTERLGVRYVDRLGGDALRQIGRLVRPEVLGLSASPAAEHVIHSLSETRFSAGNANLLARWGRLPAGVTTDPTLEPANEASWILDLDMFTLAPKPFDVADSLQTSRQFAERIYTVFRWAVTDEFLRHFGGLP